MQYYSTKTTAEMCTSQLLHINQHW